MVDQLASAGARGDAMLVRALEIWKSDRAVFLPAHLIDERLLKLQQSIDVADL